MLLADFRFRVDNRIPAHIDRNFHPQPSSTSDLGTRSKACQVTGSHRYKFFNRQIYSGLAASNSLEAALITGQDANVVEFQHEKPTSGTRTIGIQSDYRESECQTLPWEPEYHVPEKPSLKQQYRSSRFHCDGPEVLALKHLTFGNGLPAGLNEIDHIDKLRAKRAFEASLPAIDDLEQLPIRQQLIEEWEEKDWAERCNEIAGLQAERLAFLEEAIECREQRRDEEVQAIVQSRKERHVSMNEKAVASIEKQRVKTVRHLSSLRKQAGVLWPKRKASFVHEYANYGSQKYAPLQRLGQFPDNQPPGKQIVTESFQPETIKEVSDLETYMRGHLKEAKVQGPSKELLKGHQSRKTLEVHKILRTISSKLEQAKGTNGLGYGDCWLSPIDEILEQPSAVSKGKFAGKWGLCLSLWQKTPAETCTRLSGYCRLCYWKDAMLLGCEDSTVLC